MDEAHGALRHNQRGDEMAIIYEHNGNQYPNGLIALKNGDFVRMLDQAYLDNDCNGDAAYFARGYLLSEDEDDESGATVKVMWEIYDDCECDGDESNACDWDSPVAVTHYAHGNLELAD